MIHSSAGSAVSAGSHVRVSACDSGEGKGVSVVGTASTSSVSRGASTSCVCACSYAATLSAVTGAPVSALSVGGLERFAGRYVVLVMICVVLLRLAFSVVVRAASVSVASGGPRSKAVCLSVVCLILFMTVVVCVHADENLD